MSILFSSSGSAMLSSKGSRILTKPFLVESVVNTQSEGVKNLRADEPDVASSFVMKKCQDLSK